MTATEENLEPLGTSLASRALVEDFLYVEAELLDAWELNEWLNLFEPGATYEVPATDMPAGEPETSLFLVADDWIRIQARVKRLMSKNAHVENPRSRTRRIVGNVRVRDGDEPGTFRVRAAFMVHRMRYDLHDVYVGQYDHTLVADSGGRIRFRRRKAILDLESLRPAGKVSVIL